MPEEKEIPEVEQGITAIPPEEVQPPPIGS